MIKYTVVQLNTTSTFEINNWLEEHIDSECQSVVSVSVDGYGKKTFVTIKRY